ncbi:MAG: hypothetical protein QM504_17265 [Pseudomonadota bacterium]
MQSTELSNKLLGFLADYKKLMPRCWQMLEQAYLNKGKNNNDWQDYSEYDKRNHVKAAELRGYYDIILPLILYVCSDTYRESEPNNYPSYPSYDRQGNLVAMASRLIA